MELSHAREEIDRIDNEIIELVAKRLSIAKEIAKIKNKLKLPFEDKERETQLLKARIKKMKELGVDDAEFVKLLFAVIIKKSKEIQKETMERK